MMEDEDHIFYSMMDESLSYKERLLNGKVQFQDPEDDVLDCEWIIENSVTPKVSHAQNNFSEFYSKINEFYVDDKYTDVCIRCQHQTYHCHRIILAAASQYFDTMFYGGLGNFKENHQKEISLHDVDVEAFEEVLRFTYKGVVRVSNDNVYNLLHVSEMLGLTFVEKECTRYLTHYDAPLNCALDIFLFAHSLQKNSLIRIMSQYILKNVDLLSRRNDLLKLSSEELKTLLIYWQASSEEHEKSLLSAVARWVSFVAPLSVHGRTSCVSDIMEYTDLQHFSAEYAVNYCLEVVSNYDGSLDRDILCTSHSDFNEKFSKLNLHVYVNTLEKQGVNEWEDAGLPGEPHLPQTNLFTLQKSGETINWYPSCTLTPRVSELRSVILDDQLYCLKTQQGKYSFTVCSSVDLSNERVLKHPLLDSSYFMPSICGFQNSIYGPFHSDTDPQQLLIYNCELNKWSTVPAESVAYYPTITCDSRRVYVLGGTDTSGRGNQSSGGTRDVQAYDYRAGKWIQLPKSILRHLSADQSCCHEGKIYVTNVGAAGGESDLLDVYDTRAAKWELINMKHSLYFGRWYSYRLMSYDKRLWVVSSEMSLDEYENDCIRVQVYDSFLQDWITSETLDYVAKNEIYRTCDNTEDRWFMRILDVVNFKSL